MTEVVIGELYRHFKGKLYQVLNVAFMEDSDEKMVVYQALYGDYKVYVRSYESFAGPVDRIKYPKAEQAMRFERLSPEKRRILQAREEKVSTERELAKINMQEIVEFDEREVTKIQEEIESEEVNKDLLAFLDAETNEEKLDVLQVIRKDMTEKIMSSIEASMDLCFVEASLEDRIERAIDMLRTKIRYEGTRMR